MLIFGNKLFKKPLRILKAFNNEEFLTAFREIEELSKKYYLAGYIRYEAKEVFLGEKITLEFPLLYFEVFEDFKEFSPHVADLCRLKSSSAITFEQYKSDLEKIKEEIANGNTYEVNYTYDRHVDCEADEFELFNFLLKKQATPYNAFIKNDIETIFSFSPELFFELKNGHILTKPMKGTVPRGMDEVQDKKNVDFLKNDIKNRAENVMIVDLLRNDLGRIAKTGSVKVSKLFEIETHKTLHQMTSQIEADLLDGTTFFEVFKAIFPCGSITGAPKISTMKIIDRLEKGSREVYCGAIGLISPKKTAFSVPIRILQKKSDEKTYRYRVGGAIVWNSDIKEEWKETLTKSKILEEDFKLIETIKVECGKPFLWAEHLGRLKNSAKHFGFNFNPELETLKPTQDGMLRILLSKDGSYSLEYKKLVRSEVCKVEISPKKVDSRKAFLYHKTTYRPYYEESFKKIVDGKIYDELFFNEKGELTEGARSNVLLTINGKLYTPPVKCGLLNGVLRQNLLDRGICTEKILYKEDLLHAENVYCINSVRGIRRVEL